jgi:RNA recognition motif-containing protein
MDENDLRKMFEEFGRVHQINVLRDKVTGQSKGKGISNTAQNRNMSTL